MDESKIISDGQALGLDGAKLLKYVEERRVREEKRRQDEIEREERRQQREEARLMLEAENKRLHELNEAKRLERNDTSLNGPETSKTKIKLAQYQEKEDISIYIRNFERVRDVNGWSEDVAISALINGFSGTKVSIFLDTLPSMPYTECYGM